MLSRALVLLFVLLPVTLGAQPIEGAAQRYAFQPGDKVLYQTELAKCPVGELLPDIGVAKGAYECARFRDRIWLRPLDMGTVLAVPFPEPVPAEFSLEFPIWIAAKGCPYVEVRLHTDQQMLRLHQPMAYAYGSLAGAHLACDMARFGVRDDPGQIRFDLSAPLGKETVHRIAIQVRRGLLRFFVDGRRVAQRPFHPRKPIAGLSLYFYRTYDAPVPYAEAPALVGNLRLATYSTAEAVPAAEQDLIRDLGAVATPEGLKVTLSEAILFDFGKWTLKPGARETLDKLARLAKLRRGRIRVEGHTDNVGGERFNQVLSELRAHVVALALARRGIDARRLVPRGFGENRPVASNDTEQGRARNRRVEVILENAQS